MVIPPQEEEPEQLKAGFKAPNEIKPNEFVNVMFEGFEEEWEPVLCRKRGDLLKPVPVSFSKRIKIRPNDITQCAAMDVLTDKAVEGVLITGIAGSGKTLLSLAAALHLCDNGAYEEIVYVKPLVPIGGKELGYFPGSIDEKLDEWVQPLWENVSFLKPDFDAYEDKESILYPVALPYCRGRTFRKSFIILDEAQNISRKELKAMVTRCGIGSKIVMLADISQIDNCELSEDGDDCGAALALTAFSGDPLFAHVELCQSYRSGIARLATERL